MHHFDGTILIWGIVADEGRAAAMQQLGFADVLSVEGLLDDVRVWGTVPWINHVKQLQQWSNELFAAFM